MNTIYLLSFVETPRKFIIAELSIRKLGYNSTDEDPSLRIESSAIINLRGVSTKLNKYKSITVHLCGLIDQKVILINDKIQSVQNYAAIIMSSAYRSKTPLFPNSTARSLSNCLGLRKILPLPI